MPKAKGRVASKKKGIVPLTGKITIDFTKDAKRPVDGAQMLMLAAGLVVEDSASFEVAGTIVTNCAERIRERKAYWKATKATADRAHKSVCALEAEDCKDYEDARDLAEQKMEPWIRLKRLETMQDQKQIDAAADTAQADLAARVRELRREGRMSEARELEAQASEIVAPILASDIPQVEGLHLREPWKGSLDNMMELLAAIHNGKVPLMHTVRVRGEDREEPIVYVSDRVLNHLASTLRESFDIPGCSAEPEIQFAAREAK